MNTHRHGEVMKNKYDSLLYIDFGELNPEEWTGVWEFDSLTEIKQPTIIRYIPNQTVVQFWQGPYWNEETESWENDFTNLSNFYNSDVLKGIPICRCYTPIEVNYSAELAYYIESPDVHDFCIYFPADTFEQRRNMQKLVFDVIGEVLGELGINTMYENNPTANDLFYEHNDLKIGDEGKYRKFVGSLYKPSDNGFGYLDFTLTYKFDYELANKLRRIESDINIKKYDIEDISDKVGGLWDIDPTIDSNKMDLDVIQLLAKKLNYSLDIKSPTDEIKSRMFKRGRRRMTEKDWYLYGDNSKFPPHPYRGFETIVGDWIDDT